jgi:hypothetical protein
MVPTIQLSERQFAIPDAFRGTAAVGVLISRNAHRLPCFSLSMLFLTFGLIAALMSPIPERDPLFDVICALVVFPILINESLGSSVPSTYLLARKFLGDISYRSTQSIVRYCGCASTCKKHAA